MLFFLCFQGLYEKLNRMVSIAADMFVGRERFATMLLMRLTETVILWLSEDQTFWEDIEEGPRPLGDLGLQQVCKTDIGSVIASILHALVYIFTFLILAVIFGYEIRPVFRFARPLLV